MALMDIEILGTVGERQKAFFARQLATMLGSGMPINKAVSLLADQEHNTILREALVAIQKDLENGLPFSQAVAKHSKIFDRVFINIVISGEAVGNLAQVLMQLASQMERSLNFSSRVKSAFAYPTFVVVVLVIIAVLMMIYVVPQLEAVFADVGARLPWMTNVVIAISRFLANNLFLIALLLFATSFGLYGYFHSKAGERVFDILKIHLPAELGYDIYMARLTRTLGMLVQGGTPIIEALDVTSAVMNNVFYYEALQNAINDVKRGTPLSVPLAQNQLFPPLVGQMTLVGEQTGQLDAILIRLADYYEELVDTKLKSIAGLIEPMVIVLVGLGVGFMVYSILVPIYNLAQF